MSAQSRQLLNMQTPDKQSLNKRLEAAGWGLFLIMIGGLGFVPGDQVPAGTWLIGTGLIFLGLNVARFISGIDTSGFTVVLGLVALLSGLGDFLHVQLPLFPILLILVGAHIILKPYLERDEGRPS